MPGSHSSSFETSSALHFIDQHCVASKPHRNPAFSTCCGFCCCPKRGTTCYQPAQVDLTCPAVAPGTSPKPTSGGPNTALCRLAKRISQASTNSLPMPRVRRILAMLTVGADARRGTNSRQRPSTSGLSAALATSRWAMKKTEFADWNTRPSRTDPPRGRSLTQFDNRCGNKHVDRRVAEGDCPGADRCGRC